MSEPIAKRDGQRDKILVWLQMRGQRGVLNTELNEICLRYGARIHELRAAGHNITTHKLDDSRYRFVLEQPATRVDVLSTGYDSEFYSTKPEPARKTVQMTFLEDVTWRPIG